MHLRDEKLQLRMAIKERLARLSDGDRHAEGRSLSRRILEALPPEPVAICAYYPLTDEGDIRLALQTLLEKRCTLYLPRFENGKMVFRLAKTLDELVKGQFGIPEPPIGNPLLDPHTDPLYVLVPARAYDDKGHRTGRGNGGYDIWIRAQRKANPQTHFWGVCLECQIVQHIPMEEHDESVDALITARGFKAF